MQPYLVHFWHGNPDKKSNFYKKVMELVSISSLDASQMFWDATIEEWMEKWQDKFLYLPPKDSEKEYIRGKICITQHASFGQR